MKRNGWLGLIVGIPLAGLFANCCWVVFTNRVCPVLMCGVACLIGILMGYLVFAPNRGCLRLPVGSQVLLAVLSFFVEPLIHFGVLEPLSVDAAGIAEIDDLVRRQDVIRAGDGTPPNEGLDSERTRKHLLMLYAKYGACCEPGHEHISRAELAKFSPVDREILTGIMKGWERSQALALLEKTR